MKELSSSRVFYSPELDVDAFHFPAQKAWGLFTYLWDSQVSVAQAYKKAQQVFEATGLGPVACIGGALKTRKGSEPLPVQWFSEAFDCVAIENGLLYALEFEKVLNPGLFLDQTLNRQFLMEWVRGRVSAGVSQPIRVLNLFSYTGAFSVAAAAAGATETVSVDVSKRYLSWEKKNHELNRSTYPVGEALITRVLADDARLVLSRMQKKQQRFDVVVLDPPTFSKSAGKIFRIESDFIPLAEQTLDCLKEDGLCLLSLNDESVSIEQMEEALEELAERRGLLIREGKTAPGFSPRHGMKSFWVGAV